MKSVICLFLAVSVLICMTGCACRTSDVSSEASELPEFASVIGETESERRLYSDFWSSNGTVHFHLDATLPEASVRLPVAEVKPHYLTGEDVRRAAEALFPEGDFYESSLTRLDETFTKTEIREKLARWEPYADPEALYDLLGREEGSDVVKDFLEEYRQKLDTAPEETWQEPCRWEWRNEMEYYAGEEAGTDLSEGNDEIVAKLNYHNIPYIFSASTRNAENFRVNMICCYIDNGISPLNIDEIILQRQLCHTGTPTDEQKEAVRTKTEKILESVGLGQWQIAELEIAADEAHQDYIVKLRAVPVLDGVPAYLTGMGASLRDQHGNFTGHYNTTSEFSFSLNGELLSFMMATPLDIIETTELDMSRYSPFVLTERLEEELSDGSPGSFDAFWWPIISVDDKEINCIVTISELEYTLMRQTVSIPDDRYCYVPALAARGVMEYRNHADGSVIISVPFDQLVALNGDPIT